MIGIVVSKTYPEITEEMLKVAKKAAGNHKTKIIYVPGSYDIPYGVQKIIQEVNGVVTLGAVIEGKTDHDKIISHSVAKKLLDLQQLHNKPITLGLSGPKMTRQEAIDRIPRAAEVMHACIELCKL